MTKRYWNNVPIEARLFARITPTHDGCWLFPTHKGQQGYGTINFEGRMQRAHRVAWQMLRGPIPPGHHVHHRCEHPACINPEHLQVVTPRYHTLVAHAESGNVAAVHAKKTHCIHGHALTPENCLPHLLRRGIRECRECAHRNGKKWFDRNREAVRAKHKEWYETRGRALRASARENLR